MNNNKTLPLIETDRLILRQLTEEDSHALFTYFSQDQVMTYYDLDVFSTVAEAKSLIDIWALRLQNDEGMRWGIVLKESANNTVIGTCGFHSLSKDHNRAEIGYEINPIYWGRGIATEACSALIQYGFITLKYHRIEAFIDPQHIVSRKVLQKNGMQTEGILRDYFFEKGRFVDAEMLSILDREYKLKTK